MIAYKLIKVKEVEKDQEKKDKESPSEKMQELIIQSNLLSGGIENRFVVLFSNDVQQTLQDLIKVSGDDQLQKMLKEKSKGNDNDDLLQAIIHEGKSEHVDRVILYLQQILEKKVPFVPYARLGGVDGLRTSRAAFSVMIKFSEFFEDFVALVDEIDMFWDEVKDEKDRDVQLKEKIKTIKGYEQIAKRWESASKMRQWINEKKKNLIERIKKEVETEYLKKKDEDKNKKPEEEEKKATEEEKKGEEEVVQIDTSAKKVEETAESAPAQSSGGLTD